MLGDIEYNLVSFSFTRNVVQINNTSLGVGPHIATTRATYTVPAGRVAIVQFANVSALRVSAPGASGIIEVYCQYTPNGGTAQNVVFSFLNSAVVGAFAQSILGTPFYMFEADKITVGDLDQSTGGTMNFFQSVGILEFAPNGVP